MLNRLLFIIVAFLATNTYCADHEMFKNCSRVPFCNKLRTAVPSEDELFSADLNSTIRKKDLVTVNLKNKQDDLLVLTIRVLENNTFRVAIEEQNSKRHHLDYSLKEPLKLKEINVVDLETSNFTTLTIKGNVNDSAKVIVNPSPLTIEFYLDEKLETTLDGSRLIMENTVDSKSFSFLVNFSSCATMYGLHEHATHISLQHTADGSIDPYHLMNCDAWAHEINSTMAMYGSIPVMYAHGDLTSGLFVHNAAQQWIDIDQEAKSAYFMIESGTLDVFIMLGPTLPKVVRQYTALTGLPHLPQLWTLGYHQSRWGYFSQDDVEFVINSFDENNFSLDVIWLDFNWTNHGRYFEWNTENYSDPTALLDWMDETNRKLVTIMDPHIKIDMNYSVYAGAKEKDLFVKWANGSTYENSCWPGQSSWLDFLNPETRDYYASQYSYDKFKGSTPTLAGIWNDMNEPALFDDSTMKTFPFDNLHYGNVAHRDVHNLYGHMQIMSTHQGLMARDNETRRPFILTRAHFAGSQRYAAMWTGDNTSDWPYLGISWAMCLTTNLLGMAWCGADIPGFEGHPSEELATRWYQAGIWLPFYRAHANIDSERREPYLFSNQTQEYVRDAIRLRYKHLPVWYTLFYEHVHSGDPVIRPLIYHYPDDKNVLNMDDELLLGRDILAVAISEPNVTSKSVYFPGATDYWYQVVGDETVYLGNSTESISAEISFSPVFYRAGSIIPRKDDVQRSATDMIDVPYTLHVMLTMDNVAEGTLYQDDFESFEYRNSNAFNYVRIVYDDASKNVTLSQIHEYANPTDFPIKITEVMVHHIKSMENGKGTYEKTSYTKTADGTPLVDLHLDVTRSNAKTIILG